MQDVKTKENSVYVMVSVGCLVLGEIRHSFLYSNQIWFLIMKMLNFKAWKRMSWATWPITWSSSFNRKTLSGRKNSFNWCHFLCVISLDNWKKNSKSSWRLSTRRLVKWSCPFKCQCYWPHQSESKHFRKKKLTFLMI